jgi:hypothetical protein
VATFVFNGGGGGADTSIVTAGAADVLAGKVIVDANGNPLTGTMPDKSVGGDSGERRWVTTTGWTGGGSTLFLKIPAAGYYEGLDSYVYKNYPDLNPANVRKNVTIVDGIVGTFDGRVSASQLTKVILSTSQTWTVPAGVTRLYLWMCGGGSQGEPYITISSSGTDGMTGFSSMPREYMIDVTPGQQFAVVIGAAEGGDTSFGNYTAAGAKKFYGNTTDNYYGNAGQYIHYSSGTNAVMQAGQAGNAGTMDAFGHSANRGYCWITEEVYSGGGPLARLRAGSAGSTVTLGPAAASLGGGPALPSVVLKTNSGGTITGVTVNGNITPASKWGAGGAAIYVNNDATTTYVAGTDFAAANSYKWAAYQGVVIIGYL